MKRKIGSIILNKENETDNVIIFVHIPKTGGSTLRSIIDKQYRVYDSIQAKTHLNTCATPWFPELSLEQKKKIKVINGHFMFGVHNNIPQKKYTYMTILRNPIERVISHFYFFCKTNTTSSSYNPKLTLYEYVSKERFDLQTYILAGNTEYDLKTAKNNLKKYFSIVGVTERFSETLYAISKKLGWKDFDVYDYDKFNITPNRPSLEEIPDEIIEIIKRKNKKDIELYQLANKMLDKQLRQIED